jgi:hypothetical protein
MATVTQGTFPGFQFPTTTPVPDEVLDVLMPQLSGAELKVLLYICRRTFGFKKPSDSISLHQIAHGITTRDGRVLDGGTGLSKRHVINALKVLEKRNIITVTRQVDETGLNEVNTYSLNMLDTGRVVGTKSPQGVVNSSSPGGSEKNAPGVVNSSSPTTNREQETVLQETDVVDVAQDLQNFGIAQSAATRLMHDYPAAYIREKLEMAQGLMATGSCLVSQNPAGWLRRAIEEDYSPPRNYQRSRQHPAREKKDAKLVQAEPREQHMPKVRSQQARSVSTEMGESQQTVATQYRENKTEKKEPEKTSRENETTWNKTLEQLKEDLPASDAGDADRWLIGTTLLQVTDTVARIGVPSTAALLWLERRLYRQIYNAMKGVLGKDLDLHFVAAS